MFKCAFYNHFYRPYTLETAGLNGRSLTTRLATPPLWLLRLKLYVGATRDFLHPTTASTLPTPLPRPRCTPLLLSTGSNCYLAAKYFSLNMFAFSWNCFRE